MVGKKIGGSEADWLTSRFPHVFSEGFTPFLWAVSPPPYRFLQQVCGINYIFDTFPHQSGFTQSFLHITAGKRNRGQTCHFFSCRLKINVSFRVGSNTKVFFSSHRKGDDRKVEAKRAALTCWSPAVTRDEADEGIRRKK